MGEQKQFTVSVPWKLRHVFIDLILCAVNYRSCDSEEAKALLDHLDLISQDWPDEDTEEGGE